MAERMVAVSVLQLLHADGVIRWARADDIVDVEGEDLERGDRLGYLVPVPEPVEVVLDPVVTDITDPPVVESAPEPQRPNKTAPVKAWEDYAVALFEVSKGKRGLKRADAEASTKPELIELFS